MIWISNDDVVENFDFEKLTGSNEITGDFYVRFRWSRITARVRMRDNDCGSTGHYCQSKDFPRMTKDCNRTGIARLDSYYDPNKRKYYLTPQSVELAVHEEKAKAAKINEASEPIGKVPNDAERATERTAPASEGDLGRIKELEKEVVDLKILNKGKDFILEQLQKERNVFFDQLLTANRKMGNWKQNCSKSNHHCIHMIKNHRMAAPFRIDRRRA